MRNKLIPLQRRIDFLLHRMSGRYQFVLDYIKFKRMAKTKSTQSKLLWSNRRPMLSDKTAMTAYDTHYILHPAWAARILAQTKPKKHIDISSTLTFSTIISAFIPVDFYDLRPTYFNLTNLRSLQGDLMSLPFQDDSVLSISCMHTIEHIGLGRYGDPIDPEGDLKAIEELKRVTAPGGTLLFVVPIGKPRIVFNAHRIYSFEQIIDNFIGFELREFSLIPDSAIKDGILIHASKEMADKQNYGCGCFWFIKR